MNQPTLIDKQRNKAVAEIIKYLTLENAISAKEELDLTRELKMMLSDFALSLKYDKYNR